MQSNTPSPSNAPLKVAILGPSRDQRDWLREGIEAAGMSTLAIDSAPYLQILAKPLKRYDEVIVVDRPDNPDAVAKALADRPDVVCIVSSFEEYVPSAVRVATLMNYPFRQGGARFVGQTKEEQHRDLDLAGYGDMHPQWALINDVNDITHANLKFPLVVKAANSGGSRGVLLVQDLDEARRAIDALHGMTGHADVALKAIVAEEYSEGNTFSVQGYVRNGQARLCSFATTTVMQARAEGLAEGLEFVSLLEIAHVMTSNIPDFAQRLAQAFVDATDCQNGPLQLDGIETEGQALHVDGGYRPSGGGLWKLTEWVSGAALGEHAMAAVLNCDEPAIVEPRFECAGKRILRSAEEIDIAVDIIEQSPVDLHTEFVTADPGEPIEDFSGDKRIQAHHEYYVTSTLYVGGSSASVNAALARFD